MTETQTDPIFLTVKELADLLRLKERKIYDLAASGEIPCSRATGKLLFPRDGITAWIAASSQTGQIDTPDRPAVFLGSHDPLLEWALRQSRCGLATFFDGSTDGLDRLAQGEGMAAGIHLYDTDADAWNIPSVQARFAGQNLVLIRFATRTRGLVLSPGLSGQVTSLEGLKGQRVTLRQPESGTATIFAAELARAGLTINDLKTTGEARSEMDAVLSVAQSEADATFGLQPLADQFRLGFLPLVTECFDLLVCRKAWFEPPFQAFLAFCQSPGFATRAKAQAGYDVSDLGKVLWNG